MKCEIHENAKVPAKKHSISRDISVVGLTKVHYRLYDRNHVYLDRKEVKIFLMNANQLWVSGHLAIEISRLHLRKSGKL